MLLGSCKLIQHGNSHGNYLSTFLRFLLFISLLHFQRTLLPTTSFSADQIIKENAKRKISLGFSHLDWVQLTTNAKDLAGTSGRILRVKMSEVKSHSTSLLFSSALSLLMNYSQRKSAWLALRGKVYNISPYLRYHPGGIQRCTTSMLNR